MPKLSPLGLGGPLMKQNRPLYFLTEVNVYSIKTFDWKSLWRREWELSLFSSFVSPYWLSVWRPTLTWESQWSTISQWGRPLIWLPGRWTNTGQTRTTRSSSWSASVMPGSRSSSSLGNQSIFKSISKFPQKSKFTLKHLLWNYVWPFLMRTFRTFLGSARVQTYSSLSRAPSISLTL